MLTEAVRRSLQHILATLTSLDTPLAIMGGIAVASWRHLRVTRDIDLLVGVPESDVEEVVGKLQAAGFRPERQPPMLAIGEQRLVRLLYEPPEMFLDVQIDLFLATTSFQTSALARRVATKFPGLDREVAVVSCEDLIVFKLLAGRIIDRADAAMLLRLNRDTMDLDYLFQGTARLQLQTDLAVIWDEAFPGETPTVHA